MKVLSLLPLLATFAPKVAAHYRWTALIANGTVSTLNFSSTRLCLRRILLDICGLLL